jgi:predicted membrane protein
MFVKDNMSEYLSQSHIVVIESIMSAIEVVVSVLAVDITISAMAEWSVWNGMNQLTGSL